MSSICRLIGTVSHTNDKRNLKYISNVMAVLLQAQLPCLKLKIIRIAEFTLAIMATFSSGISKKLKKCLCKCRFFHAFSSWEVCGKNRMKNRVRWVFFRSIILQFWLFVVMVVWSLKIRSGEAWDKRRQIWSSHLDCVFVFSVWINCVLVFFLVEVNTDCLWEISFSKTLYRLF